MNGDLTGCWCLYLWLKQHGDTTVYYSYLVEVGDFEPKPVPNDRGAPFLLNQFVIILLLSNITFCVFAYPRLFTYALIISDILVRSLPTNFSCLHACLLLALHARNKCMRRPLIKIGRHINIHSFFRKNQERLD